MKYNSQTITIEVNSVHTIDVKQPLADKKETRLKAIALDLLISGNYNTYFAGKEIEGYKELTDKAETLIQEMKELYLRNK